MRVVSLREGVAGHRVFVCGPVETQAGERVVAGSHGAL